MFVENLDTKNKNKPMPHFNYDVEGDVLSWELNDLMIDDSFESGDWVIEVSQDRIPVYITLLNASKHLGLLAQKIPNQI